MTFSFHTLLVALLLPVSVKSFPTGAGGCVADEAAVGGPHASSAEISFEPFSVMLNDSIALTSSTSLVQGESYKITLVSSTQTFRGGLLRMQGAGELEASTNGRILEEICGDAQGVTHTSAMDKTELSAVYTVSPDDTQLTLDVTVVPTIAEFTHAQFVISVEDGASPGGDDFSISAPPSPSPTTLRPTTASPTTTMPTTETPTTAAPVASRVEPESSFTITPVPETTTNTPPGPGPTETAMPILPNPAPIDFPVAAPIVPTPIGFPVAAPVVPAPIGFPMAAPVEAPVFAPVSFATTPPANIIPIMWTPSSFQDVNDLQDISELSAMEENEDEEAEQTSSRTEESTAPSPSAANAGSSLSPSPHMDGSFHVGEGTPTPLDGGLPAIEETPSPNTDPFPSIPLTWTPAPAGSASTLDALASGSSTTTLAASFVGLLFTLLSVF